MHFFSLSLSARRTMSRRRELAEVVRSDYDGNDASMLLHPTSASYNNHDGADVVAAAAVPTTGNDSTIVVEKPISPRLASPGLYSIRVPSFHVLWDPRQPVGQTKFTVFKIQMRTHHGGVAWTVLKRYSELLKFHEKVLQIRADCFFPDFPMKKRISKFDAEFLETRRREIEVYFQRLLDLWERADALKYLLNSELGILGDFYPGLMRLAFCGDMLMMKHLIEDCDIDILDSRDANDGTALHYAAAAGQDEMLKFLISRVGGNTAMFDLSTVKDKYGISVEALAQLRKTRGDFVLDHRVPLQYRKLDVERNYYILVNPFGGTKKAPTVLDRLVRPYLEALGIRFTVVETQRQNHAKELAMAVDFNEFDVIMTVSGDGLAFEVLNGLAARGDMGLSHNSPIRLPFTVVPAGSGNGLSQSLEWKNCFTAITRIVTGVATPIDAIECFQPATATKCYSFLSTSWGAIPDIDFQSETHRWMGEFRFTYTALQKIAKKKEYQCKLAFAPLAEEDEKLEDRDVKWNGVSFDIPENWTVVNGNTQVMIGCNVNMISSDFKAAPFAKINDGLIHLLYAQGLNRAEMVKLFLLLENGEHVGKPGVSSFTTKKFIVEPITDDTSFDFDGEKFDNIPTMFQMKHNFASIIM
eukprot:TRINITY_DN10131_c0_g1_i2.p1 TRINITY_DN10131_c0_g1~~TRINITY_DN10131_c0_g1_i2.p1  ORF type:complete len:640 (+),score=187.42 TRINITY_DN10131_c0_g1_i2:655-2574(+)